MFLQKIVGTAQDSIVGLVTLAAVCGQAPTDLIERLMDDRLAHLKRLSNWSTFGRGWTNRIEAVRAGALQMGRTEIHQEARELPPSWRLAGAGLLLLLSAFLRPKMETDHMNAILQIAATLLGKALPGSNWKTIIGILLGVAGAVAQVNGIEIPVIDVQGV